MISNNLHWSKISPWRNPNTVPVGRTVISKQFKSIQRRTASSNERLNVEESAASKKNGQSKSSMNVYVRNTQSWRKRFKGRTKGHNSSIRIGNFFFELLPAFCDTTLFYPDSSTSLSTIDATTQIPGVVEIDQLVQTSRSTTNSTSQRQRNLKRGGSGGDKRRRASRLGHGE